MGKLDRVKTKPKETGGQTTQEMTQKLELSLTERATKKAKPNGLNRTRSYKKKNNRKASGQKLVEQQYPRLQKIYVRDRYIAPSKR